MGRDDVSQSVYCKRKINEPYQRSQFCVNDVLLYLDTHPCCEEAISFYQECEQERQKLLKEYAQCYGPLTVDAALESGGDTWKWVQQPIPMGNGRRVQIVYVEL